MLLSFLKLVRPQQWYKNFLVFLALIFSRSFFDIDKVYLSLIGFGLLILISSANYILNDYIDVEKDRLNPDKKSRPLASGAINPNIAFIVMLILLFIAFVASFLINPYVFIAIFAIYTISTIYTFLLKNIIFADLIAIASLFILRAVTGAIIIDVYISPWLVAGIFFLAMFLVSGKRYGELVFLGKNAGKHRKVLELYSKEILLSLLNVFMAILIVVFAIYSFFSEYKLLIWTTPLFAYLVLRYYFLIVTNSEIIRNPDKVITDLPFVVGGMIFTIISFFLIILG